MKFIFLIFLISCATEKTNEKFFTFTCFENGKITATGTSQGIVIYNGEKDFKNCHFTEIDRP